MKTITFLVVALLIVVNPEFVFSQEYKWMKIQPVESTISDVEKLLGRTEVKGYSTRHYSDDGIYVVRYSDGKCNPEWDKDWNIPEWRVVSIFFGPEDSFKVSSLGIKLSKLKKTLNSRHTPGVFDYTDKSKGMAYTVQRDFDTKSNVVTNITVSPAAKYNNLACKKD